MVHLACDSLQNKEVVERPEIAPQVVLKGANLSRFNESVAAMPRFVGRYVDLSLIDQGANDVAITVQSDCARQSIPFC
jgi:hypothetical protein